MSTALFQCFDPDIARNIERCLPTTPVLVTGFQTVGNMASVVFNGDCSSMYWWCMDVSNKFGSYVSFIGVDERSNKSSDKYRLAVLTSGTPSSAEQGHLSELIERFMTAVLRMKLTEQQLMHMFSQCVLGQFDDMTLDMCINRVRVCIAQGKKCDYKSILGGANDNWYVRGIMVRFMAHICYLDDAVKSGAAKKGSTLRSMFR